MIKLNETLLPSAMNQRREGDTYRIHSGGSFLLLALWGEQKGIEEKDGVKIKRWSKTGLNFDTKLFFCFCQSRL